MIYEAGHRLIFRAGRQLRSSLKNAQIVRAERLRVDKASSYDKRRAVHHF